MESDANRSEKRGRKRGRGESKGLEPGNLVGRHVRKEFEGLGVFSGKIVRYKRGGLYRVNYEDGDREDLEYDEVRAILVDSEVVVPGKERLDQSVLGESVGVSKVSSEGDAGSDADSSSVSGKIEAPPIGPQQLPPSSGSIGVSEESVGFLFSVYNFLRSFSHQLFLSPFVLEDFVGALNHSSQNYLLDAIHVSLLRALRRHLEEVSSDGSGSGLASKCLRCLDWSLIDTLTWTVYVVEYLYMMGYTKGKDWKGFHEHVLNREYYSLSVHTKLRVLQFLCDDLLEFAELRAEINMRECEEEGINVDDDAMLTSENGPKRVHPRYSKTSACKDAETMENIVEPCESKPSHNGSSADSSQLIELEANASDAVDDGNGDECKLCGMDGTLLCCDGCPYAYHPRCIGLTKASIPEGQWFCPECSVNKMGPVCSRIGKGLRGAEVFGIDPFERLFLGTCNYVLVLETSINAEPICRYYSHNDVLELLRVLCSSAQHALLYSQICKGILQYYEISEDAILLHSGGTKSEAKCLDGDDGTEPDINPLDGKEQAACTKFFTKENHIPLDSVEQENCLSNASGSNVENGEASLCRENEYIEAGVNGPMQDLCKGGLKIQQKDVKFAPEYTEMTAQQLGTESTISVGSQILPADPSDLNLQSSGKRSIVLELATCASRDADGAGREDAGSVVLCSKNSILSTSLETGLDHCSDGSKGDIIGCSSYMGTSFRPQRYINQYILGDIAASAAANLAVLTSENSKPTESQSSKPSKVTSGNITIQIKAFTAAALHFHWPSSEKKFVDVPRERCGWCMACKLAETNRKGCLLNSVAFNALRGDPKVIGGVRPIKNREGPLPAVAAFILNIEECLRGLIVGPLLTFSYRRQWRKQLEQASTCNSLKYLLLDLEENIHLLAFSSSWVKPVDDWSFKFATAQFGTCNVGSAQKRGPSTRKNRKQSATSAIMADANWKTVHWWRGGKLSNLVFQTGILPSTMVKKAARQGGKKKISGIHYVEGSEIPRRSRRFAWRAAVERSKNASQLALQVRCLDAHIRWSDIVRPELNSPDGKGLDIETSAFRNAFVCDKKIVEGKIRYALAFRNQKHLPSRIMKNVIEVEQSPYGKERYWFSESHIPLYLIKDYEGKAERVAFPLLKTSHFFSKIPRRQLKPRRRDILSYLAHRDDMSSCALCQQDVLLRNAVKCNACQGYCHKDCAVPSTAELIDQFEFLHLCKQCHQTQSTILNRNFGCPKIQLSLEEQQGIHLGNVEAPPKKKPSSVNRGSVSRKGTSLTWGLVWRKKNSKSDSGTDFRLKNILLRGVAGMDPSMRPECNLCKEPYNSNLMYICCEHCSVWYHADAVQLKEEDIFKLEGFKCCKCRRKTSPVCPYMSEERKLCMKTAKKQVGMERNQMSMLCAVPGYVVGKPELAEPTSPVLLAETEDVLTEEYDPLLFSLENVELITEQMPEISPESDAALVLYQNPQKLPVRRHVKLENDSGGFSAYPSLEDQQKLPVRRHVKLENDSEGFSAYPSHEDPQSLGSNLESIKEEALPPEAEWDFPIGDELAAFQGGEDIEFEPQTYFSFTELLATEDDRMNERSDNVDGLYDAPPVDDVPGCWGNSSGCGMDVDQAMPSYNSFNSSVCDIEAGQDNLCETYMGVVERLADPVLADPVPCGMCSQIQPDPDLLCEICGLQIHSHCSPWEEPSSFDHKWRCGRCRDWR